MTSSEKHALETWILQNESKLEELQRTEANIENAQHPGDGFRGAKARVKLATEIQALDEEIRRAKVRVAESR